MDAFKGCICGGSGLCVVNMEWLIVCMSIIDVESEEMAIIL